MTANFNAYGSLDNLLEEVHNDTLVICVQEHKFCNGRARQLLYLLFEYLECHPEMSWEGLHS